MSDTRKTVRILLKILAWLVGGYLVTALIGIVLLNILLHNKIFLPDKVLDILTYVNFAWLGLCAVYIGVLNGLLQNAAKRAELKAQEDLEDDEEEE